MIIVPTLHPMLLARSSDEDGFSKYEHVVVADLRKGRRLMTLKPTWDESIIFERDAAGRPWRLFPTVQEVEWFIARFLAACSRFPQLVEQGHLSLTTDVETTRDAPLLSQLINVGFGFRAPDEEQVINVPILCCGGFRYWSETDEIYVRGLWSKLLARRDIVTALHNKAFDKAVLWAQGMPILGWSWCTMAAHQVWDGELPHNLAFVNSLLTDGRYWKDDAKGDGGNLAIPDEIFRAYNLRDILATQRIQPVLHGELVRLRQWPLYLEQLRATEVMCRASIRGMLIDEERRTLTAIDPKTGKHVGLRPAMEAQRDEALKMLREVSNDPGFEPSKPTQVSALFFQKLGFPVVLKSEKTGQPKVDKEALMLLELLAATREQRVALRGVIQFRQAEKTLSTFVTGLGKFIHPATWRFHTQWKLLAVSGRFTSSPNAQNWGKWIKRMFRSAQGYKFVGVDLSQAELRFIAYLANDAALLQMYRDGINVHTVNACLLFKIQCPDPSDLNPQTEKFLRSEMIRVHGVDYSTLPMLPLPNWKPVRTLAKNFVFGCLDKDTAVATLDGKKKISEIQPGDYVWCWDGVKYVHTKVKRAWCTGTKRVVKVTVRDGARKLKTLTLTPNHNVMLRSGEYQQAGLLKKGDRLMPFRRTPANGYREIDPFNNGTRMYEHRWVLPGEELVHHDNENPGDNRPENLKGTTRRDHLRDHHGAPDVSPEGRERTREALRLMWAIDREARVEKLTAARVASPKWQEGQKQGAVTRAARGIRKPKTQGVCACGAQAIAKGLCKKCYAVEYRLKKNHEVISVEYLDDAREVWDLEVEHPAHNFALADAGFFVSNSNYGAEAETVFRILRSKRDPDTNKLLFPTLILSEIQALRIMWIKRLHPEIATWWDAIQLSTRKAGGYFSPMSGRARLFRGGFKRNEMLNYPIQEGVAAWMNKCMVEIQDVFDRETGGACQIIQQVHDALNSECPEEYAVRAGQVKIEILNRHFPLHGHSAQLPADKADINDYLDKV